MRDPYETLGVPRDATPEQIKRAGRKAQKRTHPDAGGDRAEFEAVQRALTVLMDPDKREHFDRTGEAQTGSPEAQEAAESHALLQMVMGQVMEEGDARHIDLPKRVRERLGAMSRELSGQKSDHQGKARASLDKLTAFQKRLKKKGGGEDALGAMLVGQIGAVERSLASAVANIERRLRIVDRALKMSQGYEYEVERTPPQQARHPMSDLLEQEYRRQGGIFSSRGGGKGWFD